MTIDTSGDESSDPLLRAIAALEIRTVDLVACTFALSDAFRRAGELDPSTFVTHGAQGVESAQRLEGTLGAPDGPDIALVRYVLSTELVVSGDVGDGSGDSNVELLTLKAQFEAEYQAIDGTDDEAIVAFGQRNVAYHVWPYWRELTQTTVGRTRFPAPVQVPHYFARRGFIDGSLSATQDASSNDVPSARDPR